jgi:ribonucleotide monophosphatase NagD (HAD superfamily)
MVGDTIESDIVGGNSNGFKTILVESGNYKKGDTIIQKEEY